MYLARTDKRGAQGAGVPVLGRSGIEVWCADLRFSASGVAGESGGIRFFPTFLSFRELNLLLFNPGENIFSLFSSAV